MYQKRNLFIKECISAHLEVLCDINNGCSLSCSYANKQFIRLLCYLVSVGIGWRDDSQLEVEEQKQLAEIHKT